MCIRDRFWSIAAGIVLAAGLIPLAVFGSVFIGVFLLIFANKKSHVNPYIVVLRCDGHESEAAATEFLKEKVQRLTVKSKTVQKLSLIHILNQFKHKKIPAGKIPSGDFVSLSI